MMNRIRAWLRPQSAIEWLATALYGGVLLIYLSFAGSGAYPLEYPWLGSLIILPGILLLLILERIENRWYEERSPSWRASALIQGSRLLIIVVFSWSDGLGLMEEPYLLLFLLFAFFLTTGSSYGLTGLTWILYLLSRAHLVSEESLAASSGFQHLTFALFGLLFLGFLFAIAYLVKRERRHNLRTRKLLQELEISHQKLQLYAEQAAELATMEERNRLAREIHDSLGHYMTVINVQLEKAIAFRQRDPAEADQAVHEAKRLASEALKDVRRSVSTLRSQPDSFSLADALREMAAHVDHDHLELELEIEGEERGFSRQALMTLYRAAQEGLTNIQKHAGASRVSMQVHLEEQQARLALIDNGRGFEPAGPEAPNEQNGHYGLQGIRERVELIRGSFEVESVPGTGTTLRVTVPKNPFALPTNQGTVTAPGGTTPKTKKTDH